MKQLLTLGISIIFLSVCYAQPNQRSFNGCHNTHNRTRRMEPLTQRELQVMNESIARSDTFDVLSYTINLDVSNYASYSLSAATTIHFEARMDGLSAIRFDLYNLVVDSVKWAETAVPYTYDG